MYDVIYKSDEGTLSILDNYNVSLDEGIEGATPYFNNIGDEYIVNISNLNNVLSLNNFNYDTIGLNSERYLLQYYRLSKNGTSWTDWYELNADIQNFPKVDPNYDLFIEIKWIRQGTLSTGSIRLLNYKIEGNLERNEQLLSDGKISLSPSEKKIIKSPFIFKVFKIIDIEIIPDNIDLSLIDIKYRYSQDNTRTWSEWEPFTKENITSIRINPIRFFQIEYYLENNSRSLVIINDINLIGDFQNVNNDYQKSNLFGIRECCSSNQYGYFDINGNYHPNTVLNTSGVDTCDLNLFKPLTSSEKANLYNPYAQNTATKLLEKLSADSEQIIGHSVTYFATDPDKNGQDHTLNEYQLYNVSCQGDLKISIDGNNFPDSQIKMNIFDLDLFDNMEAHVTKQQFKQIFGAQRRPSKEDFLYFCQVNRMYQVDHAQQFRGFNNSSVYYKLILKKYNQKSNVKIDNIDVQNELNKLVNNTTIDELFGIEQTQDKAAIANKPQTAPLTVDLIRLEYFADIDKELIENSTTIISKSNYDLSTVKYGNVAVSYKNFDPVFKNSDNLSLQIWFNIHNYIKDEIYNFMHFYDETNEIGWKSHLVNDKIVVKLNNDTYTFDLLGYDSNSDPIALEEEVWYCYVLNINQRQRNIEQFIYKRNVDYEEDAASLNSTILKKVYYDEQEMTPISYIIEDTNVYPKIIASDMKVTNIRTFIDVIPEAVHNKVLNQYIIGDDSKYLIFADNATTRLYLRKFPYNE